MRDSFFKFTGFNGAILALLMPLVAPFELHAQPSTPEIIFTKEKLRACPFQEDVAQGDYESLKEFWQQAWGRELIFGAEGMVLQETSAAGQWDILVGDKTEGRWLDRGTFVEEIRYAVDLGAASLDRVYRAVARATYLHRYVMAGTVIGSTGNSISVTAMVTEIGDESGNITRSFSIAEISADSAEMRSFSEVFAKQLDMRGVEGLEPEGLGFEKSGPNHCQNNCLNTRTTELGFCNTDYLICKAAQEGGHSECLNICLNLFEDSEILRSLCNVSCDGVLAIGLRNCSDTLSRCESDASAAYYTCIGNCNNCSLCEVP